MLDHDDVGTVIGSGDLELTVGSKWDLRQGQDRIAAGGAGIGVEGGERGRPILEGSTVWRRLGAPRQALEPFDLLLDVCRIALGPECEAAPNVEHEASEQPVGIRGKSALEANQQAARRHRRRDLNHPRVRVAGRLARLGSVEELHPLEGGPAPDGQEARSRCIFIRYLGELSDGGGVVAPFQVADVHSDRGSDLVQPVGRDVQNHPGVGCRVS